MAKVKIQRASETPVKPEEAQQFTDEFRAAYDRAEAKAKKKAENPQQEMLMMQRFLRYVEHSLRKKYKLTEEIEMPKTAKAWAALIKQYGSAIIVATTMRNEKEVVLVIMDAQL